MNFLPISSIFPEDLDLVGEQIVYLSKLKRLGFPVAEGVVVLPKSVYSEKELANLEIPPDLEKHFEGKTKKLNPSRVWETVKKSWLNQLNDKQKITSQPVFFTEEITSQGTACSYIKQIFQGNMKDTKIDIEHGSLSPSLLNQLDKIIQEMDKVLGISHTFHWLVDKEDSGALKIKIFKISPYPATYEETLKSENKLLSNILIKSNPSLKDEKSHIKLLVYDPESKIDYSTVDGEIVKGEDYKDLDSKINALVDRSFGLRDKPLLFRLSPVLNRKLNEDAKAFLFARNKKNLLNLQLAIPFVQSVDELLILKRDLAAEGISRKGSLKIWLEIATPENLLNIEGYILAGIDGLIMNLDYLSNNLGLNSAELSSHVVNDQINALHKFLNEPQSIIRKSHLPVIVVGKVAYYDEILKYLLDNQIWGLIVENESFIASTQKLKWTNKQKTRMLFVT